MGWLGGGDGTLALSGNATETGSAQARDERGQWETGISMDGVQKDPEMLNAKFV